MAPDALLPLSADHIRAWMLILLRAGTVAGFAPMRSAMLHRLVFLSNTLAHVYETVPPSEFVLKHKRGPFYPQAQFELERMAAQGLVALTDLHWTAHGQDLQLQVSFSLSEAGRTIVRRWNDESQWCKQVQLFLTDLCVAVASVDDDRELDAADHDLTYAQPWASQYTVIAFRNPQERLSQRGVEAIADMSPDGLEPNRQHQLRLYLKYLERLAA
jgi:hypothetical protein